uniref:latent-transforming growth factor beta-binding protein 1-like isoform X2 n=1 Tax=Myxine glutinosa TaxID=7769 RepID=UPI00358DF645
MALGTLSFAFFLLSLFLCAEALHPRRQPHLHRRSHALRRSALLAGVYFAGRRRMVPDAGTSTAHLANAKAGMPGRDAPRAAGNRRGVRWRGSRLPLAGSARTRPRTRSQPLPGRHVCGRRCCDGWTMSPGSRKCDKAICNPRCENGGMCLRPQLCLCHKGYTGPSCNTAVDPRTHQHGSVLAHGSKGHGQKSSSHRNGERRSSPGLLQRRGHTMRQQFQSRHKLLAASQARVVRQSLSRWGNKPSAFVGVDRPRIGDGTSLSLGQKRQRQTITPRQPENLMMPIPKRIKVIFTPTICKLHCSGENCRTNCSKGNVTTIISEDGQTIFPEKGAGFRVFVCGIPCHNGGRCNSRNKCWCPRGFTGKFCHVRTQQSSSQQAEDQSPQHSMYTLPMSRTTNFSREITQQFPNSLDLVNVHVKHPPEASVQIHQVARMDGGLPMPRQHQPHTTIPRQTGSHRHATSAQSSLPSHALHHHRRFPLSGHREQAEHFGQAGSRHWADSEVGLPLQGQCFLEVKDNKCTRPLPMLTHQDVCCGSVGAAWGIDRCTTCPEKHDHPLMMRRRLIRCPHGYRKENATYCADIDECALRGVCTKGTCINSAGNYTCVCRKGYVRDAFRHECISEKVLSTKNGSCYLAMSGDLCRLPVSIQLTKHFCCCSVGKAWGEGCERCPPPSHESFKEMCPAGMGFHFPTDKVNYAIRYLPENQRRIIREKLKQATQLHEEREASKRLHAVEQTVDGKKGVQVESRHRPHVMGTLSSYNIEGDSIIDGSRQSTIQGQRHLGRRVIHIPTVEHTQPGFIRGGTSHLQEVKEIGQERNTERSLDRHNVAQERQWKNVNGNIRRQGSGVSPHISKFNYRQRPTRWGSTKQINVDPHTSRHSETQTMQWPHVGGSREIHRVRGALNRPVLQERVQQGSAIGATLRPFEGDLQPMARTHTLHKPQIQSSGQIPITKKTRQGSRVAIGRNSTIRNLLPGYRKEHALQSYTVERADHRPHITNIGQRSGISQTPQDVFPGVVTNGSKSRLRGSYATPSHQKMTDFQVTVGEKETQRHSSTIFERPSVEVISQWASKANTSQRPSTGRTRHEFELDEISQRKSIHGPAEQTRQQPGRNRSQGIPSVEGHPLSPPHQRTLEKTRDRTRGSSHHSVTGVTAIGSHRLHIGQKFGTDRTPDRKIVERTRQRPRLQGHHRRIQEASTVSERFSQESSLGGDREDMHLTLNFCLQNPGACGAGQCIPLPRGHTCQCELGYNLNRQKTQCIDMDECLQNQQSCSHGHCHNTPGTFYCTCQEGFVPSSNSTECTDVDECLQDKRLCTHGGCRNIPGSFLCSCNAGFVASTSGTRCIDVDECENTPCSENGLCTNLPGSYECKCNRGYTPNTRTGHKTCVDVDECENTPCSENGLCTNLPGSYECKCNRGYTPSTRTGHKTCVDVDECENTPCSENGLCTNLPGSYECKCNRGYTPNTRTGHKTCVDVDECLTDSNLCPNGRCKNTQGSFKCFCNSGFQATSNEQSCEDIDECAVEHRVCIAATCTNTAGSFRCNPCEPGFKLSSDGRSCEDVDECLTDSNLCPNGRCKNIQGSFKCFCNSGFQATSNEQSCEDVDECAGGRECRGGSCINIPGSFECTCPPGHHVGPGTNLCLDIDECENETLCGEHQYCINLDGSFECFCDRGFRKTADGKMCVDVDECTYLVDICGEAHCENVEGSFLCLCLGSNEEFDVSTSKCVTRSVSELSSHFGDFHETLTGELTRPQGQVVEESAWPGESSEHNVQARAETPEDTFTERAEDPSKDFRKDCYYNLQDDDRCNNVIAQNVTLLECCCTVGAGWGTDCTIAICTSLEAEQLSPLCPKGQGFIPTLHAGLDGLLYEDADECTMFQGRLCKNGQCRNTRPGFHCVCRPGFAYDPTSLQCIDIDECQIPRSCVDAECFNTDGSYVCFCTPPSVLDETKKRCVNRTEHAATTEENSHMNICWMEVSRTSMCSRPVLGLHATYTECCCRYGAAWGLECALCPSKMSDDYAELCNIPSWGGVDHFGTYAVAPFAAHSHREHEPSFLPENFPHFLPDTNPYYQPEGEYPRQYEPRQGLQAQECGIAHGCENGRCVRVPNGFTCDCYDGYRLDTVQVICMDIDECEEGPQETSTCHNAHCLNTDGSYSCVCLPGYVPSQRPNRCMPIVANPHFPHNTH